MTKELLLGCGAARDKRLVVHGQPKAWGELTTLDNNPDHKPDVVFDLNGLGKTGVATSTYGGPGVEIRLRLPFVTDTFDEVHAYEVLEHIGAQGDFRAFFAQFEEFHRILKPGGFFCGTCPSYQSMWAWGDPSHTRVITSGTLLFLSQAEYRRQVGKTPMSDFRSIYKADFDLVHCTEDDEHLTFALKAIK